MKKRVAIVILNWNGRDLLEEFLPSVIAYTPAWGEVVVADNGSTDHSIDLLRERFPEVTLISLDHNYGFAEGYNQALRTINTEYCVLLNSDVEVTPHWLDAPIEALDNDPSIACVQPKIRAQRDRAYFEYAGAAGGYIDRYGYPFCRGRILHLLEKDEGQYDTVADLLWASGACLITRTALYKAVGGLDGGFFAHQEEIDLCWRLRARGHRIVCIPQSVVYHVGGATLQAEHPRKTFLNFRNNLLMLYKNLSEPNLRPVMRTRFWLDYIAACKYILEGHFANAKAIYEARKAFFELKSSYREKRIENLRKTIVDPIPELKQESLLLDFYLRGKRRFRDLSQHRS